MSVLGETEWVVGFDYEAGVNTYEVVRRTMAGRTIVAWRGQNGRQAEAAAMMISDWTDEQVEEHVDAGTVEDELERCQREGVRS